MKSFIKDIKSKWFFYIPLAILIIVLQCFALDAVTKPEKEEKVSMFLTCNSCDEMLSVSINEDLPDDIRTFDLGIFSQDNVFYGPYFNTYGKDSDMVVLTQRFSDICECDKYFMPLNEDVIRSYFGDVEFFYYQSIPYGIKIFDKDTKEGMATDRIEYCKEGEEENVYLFFNANSVHVGELSSNSVDEAALIILEKIWQNSK